MSTFMAAAWLDLVPGADLDRVLRPLRERCETSFAALARTPDGPRLELQAVGAGYEELAPLCAELVTDDGPARRAFLALDHDEFGGEVVALAPGGRAYQFYIYPRDEETGEAYTDEGEPSLTGVPALTAPEPSGDPGAVLAGPAARERLASLYGVPLARVEEAGRRAADSHESLGSIGEPFEPWLDALAIEWSDEEATPLDGG
ncbi:hypothetical protein [Catenuloplanes atrovinosus]|uniref:Uncharacterized protein n=1 Tax=Catenuloplanes atrovinosus TaxID=137266 RepID=A0AAE4CCZ7_9ACTN|nr:hypothetical protein [Catenuloplanes atrovinosus]MDR7277020.1 hypothetical protein [Catenuloplanes atrovinosus]